VHDTHADALLPFVSTLYVPAGQLVTDDAAAAHQLPARHARHTDWPDDGLYVPAAHGNCVAVDAPPVQKYPGAHGYEALENGLGLLTGVVVVVTTVDGTARVPLPEPVALVALLILVALETPVAFRTAAVAFVVTLVVTFSGDVVYMPRFGQ